MRRMWRALGVAMLAVGCGGRSAELLDTPAGGANNAGSTSTAGGAGGSANASAGAAPSGGAPASGGATNIAGMSSSAGDGGDGGDAGYTVQVPPKAGDGSVTDPAPNNQGFGWDTCFGFPDAKRGPADSCAACPAPTLGSSYLLFNYQPPASIPPGDDLLAQVWFKPAHASISGGLWFDVALVSGPKAGSVLSFWKADVACRNSSAVVTLPLDSILSDTPGKWTTGCLNILNLAIIEQFNLRIDTKAVIALDAVRFGPTCPQ